jgi:hypothetical protein
MPRKSKKMIENKREVPLVVYKKLQEGCQQGIVHMYQWNTFSMFLDIQNEVSILPSWFVIAALGWLVVSRIYEPN